MKIRLLRWWLWGWHDFIPLVPFYSVDVAHVQDGPRTFVVARAAETRDDAVHPFPPFLMGQPRRSRAAVIASLIVPLEHDLLAVPAQLFFQQFSICVHHLM